MDSQIGVLERKEGVDFAIDELKGADAQQIRAPIPADVGNGVEVVGDFGNGSLDGVRSGPDRSVDSSTHGDDGVVQGHAEDGEAEGDGDEGEG